MNSTKLTKRQHGDAKIGLIMAFDSARRFSGHTNREESHEERKRCGTAQQTPILSSVAMLRCAVMCCTVTSGTSRVR
jgi:hypothetical protein